MSAIHERIKERRTALGLTLAQLADMIGVKEATVQRWESGVIKTIKYDTVEQLSDVLHCSPSFLMGWCDELFPPRSAPADSDAWVLRDDEQKIIRSYRRLSEEGQRIILSNIAFALSEYPLTEDTSSQTQAG